MGLAEEATAIEEGVNQEQEEMRLKQIEAAQLELGAKRQEMRLLEEVASGGLRQNL